MIGTLWRDWLHQDKRGGHQGGGWGPASGLVVVALAANLLVNHAVSGADVAAGLGLIACLVVIARTERLSAADLGLARLAWPAGLWWGAAAAVLIGAAYAWGTCLRRCARPSPMVMAASDARCCGRSWS